MTNAKLQDFTGDPVIDGVILAVGTVTVLIAFTWRDLISMIVQYLFKDRIAPRFIIAIILTVLGLFFIRWCINQIDKRKECEAKEKQI